MFRRRRKERRKWLLAGFAPLAAGAIWVIREAILLRSRGGRGRPQPPQVYGLEDPSGRSGIDFRVATVDPGEEFAGTPVEGEEITAARMAAAGMPERQVPVTAKKKPAAGQRTGGGPTGASRSYDSAPMQSAAPSTPRTLIFDEGRKTPFPWLLALIPLLILTAVLVMGLIGRDPARSEVMVVPGGNPEVGRQAIQSWGCGSCHTIPGIVGANGKVGPKLEELSERTYLAGILVNTPENMIEWIMFPQEIQPGNAMPNTGVPEPTARDMAAYLYSLR